MHWDTFKQENYSTVGRYGGYRVGEVQQHTHLITPEGPNEKPEIVLYSYCAGIKLIE